MDRRSFLASGAGILGLPSISAKTWPEEDPRIDHVLLEEVRALINGIEAVDCHEHPDEHGPAHVAGGIHAYMKLTHHTPKDAWDLLFAEYLAGLGGSEFGERFLNRHMDDKTFLTWLRLHLPGDPEAFQKFTSTVQQMTFECYRLAFRDLFGMPGNEFNLPTVEALNERVRGTYRTQGRRAWYDTVRKRARLSTVIAIAPFPFKDSENARRGLFPDRCLPKSLLPQLRVDPLLTGVSGRKQAVTVFGMTYPELFRRTADAFGIKVNEAAAYQRLLDAVFESIVANGIRGIKNATACDRSLRFARVKAGEVDSVFRKPSATWSESEQIAAEDFAAWELAARAHQHALPYVIHTAEAARPEWADPENLRPLIAAFPHAQFVLLHAGHPKYEAACTMAREFPNVYVDMTWTQMIAPDPVQAYLTAVRRAPAERILWGGDMGSVEGMYGMWKVTRQIVARAYACLVASREMTLQQAARHAQKALQGNAQDLYQL